MAAPQGPICSAQTGTFAFRVYEYQPVDGSRKRRAPDRDDDLWVRPSKVTKGNAQEAAVCRLRCDLDCSRENLQHSQAAAEKLAREVQTRDVQVRTFLPHSAESFGFFTDGVLDPGTQWYRRF